MNWIKVNGILGLVLCGSVFLPTPCRGAGTLGRLQAIYEQSVRKIESDHAEETRARPKQYRALLHAALQTYQRQGDLNAVLAIQAEQKRFAATGSVPDASDTKTPPIVANVRTDWRERNEQADLARHRAIANLADRYTARLETLKREHTVQGRFKDAVAAQKEIDRVRGSAPVTAAQFALALAERESAPPEPPPEAEPAPVPVAPPPPPETRPPTATAKPAPVPSVRPGVCTRCEGTRRADNDCPACQGTGQCRNCQGTGQRRSGMRGVRGTVGCVTCRMTGHCRKCEGTGKRPGPCPACKGSGRAGPE